MKHNAIAVIFVLSVAPLFLGGCGQGGLAGYNQGWMYPTDVQTVYVEMFDSASFRRGHEYVLTDAVCKRLEAETPYKIVTDRDRADTLLTGYMGGIGQSVLATERNTGRPMEREVYVRVTVNWKNLKTGEALINNEQVVASASYSTQLTPSQPFDYAANVAINRAAERVIELMQEKW